MVGVKFACASEALELNRASVFKMDNASISDKTALEAVSCNSIIYS